MRAARGRAVYGARRGAPAFIAGLLHTVRRLAGQGVALCAAFAETEVKGVAQERAGIRSSRER